MDEQILYLTLKKEWFKQILEGVKKVEYREIKPYWTKRLFDCLDKPKKYNYVIFKNGYSKNCPMMKVEILEIRKNKDYEIVLGDILDFKNIEK